GAPSAPRRGRPLGPGRPAAGGAGRDGTRAGVRLPGVGGAAGTFRPSRRPWDQTLTSRQIRRRAPWGSRIVGKSTSDPGEGGGKGGAAEARPDTGRPVRRRSEAGSGTVPQL